MWATVCGAMTSKMAICGAAAAIAIGGGAALESTSLESDLRQSIGLSADATAGPTAVALGADVRGSAETRAAIEPLFKHDATVVTRIEAGGDAEFGANAGGDANVTGSASGQIDVSVVSGEHGDASEVSVSVASRVLELTVESGTRPAAQLSTDATARVEAQLAAAAGAGGDTAIAAAAAEAAADANARAAIEATAGLSADTALVEPVKGALPALTGQVCTTTSSTTAAGTTGAVTAGLDGQGTFDACAAVDGEQLGKALPSTAAGATVEATAGGGLGLGW